MKYVVALFIVLSFQTTFAAYSGFTISPDISCTDLGTEARNNLDRKDECVVIATNSATRDYEKHHKIESKIYKIKFNVDEFYKLYIDIKGAHEVVSLGYNELRVEEDTGVLPGGQRTFDPGVLEAVEWRFHAGKKPGFHGLIVKKSTFDLIAQEQRTVFHIFKLDSGKSCLLGFVDQIEVARQWSDKSDELPCQ